MRRALAVFAAVGMVVVAVLVRGAMDDDSDDGGDGGDGSLVVVCATDLADACEELAASVEVRIEDPAVTAAALDDGSVAEDVDAWITSTAWLEVAESRAPNALGDTRAIATSPATVAAARGRFDAINGLCGSDDIWRCLGESLGTSWADLGDGTHADWGELKVGLTDPDLSVGLPVLASAAAGFFGATDFATNDFATSGFDGWLADLAAGSGSGDPNAVLTLATRQGAYSAAGAVSSMAEDVGVQTIAPVVPVATTIAIAELAQGDGLPGTNGVRDTLETAGWVHATDDDLAPTLKPGVMAALHSLWRDLTT